MYILPVAVLKLFAPKLGHIHYPNNPRWFPWATLNSFFHLRHSAYTKFQMFRYHAGTSVLKLISATLHPKRWGFERTDCDLPMHFFYSCAADNLRSSVFVSDVGSFIDEYESVDYVSPFNCCSDYRPNCNSQPYRTFAVNLLME